MEKNQLVLVLVFLIFVLIGINYFRIDNFLEESFGNFEGFVVERVIDGDTIVVNSESVRLLGINTPERGEFYYDEAKEFLENRVLNKSVRFEYGADRYDKYGRVLAYVFAGGENVNLEIVENGLANCYFLNGIEKYYDECFEMWGECVAENKNLCESSEDICANCIFLEELDYENEIVRLKNNCGSECDLTDWSIKDEGRKVFVFSEFEIGAYENFEVVVGEGVNSDGKLYWKDEDYVWTDLGDTIFLRDSTGKLVLYYSY